MGFVRGWQRSLVALPLLFVGLASHAGCYDAGDGTAPPLANFYFPVGLRVSHGGTVLYAVNSDFDLQYSGGTVQSYDLRLIRQHALLAIADPTNPSLPLLRKDSPAGCPSNPPVYRADEAGRQPLGETCAPPVDSTVYVRDSAVIGAFATDLLLSQPPSEMAGNYMVSRDGQPASPSATKLHADDALVSADETPTARLFAPVRGNATITWADVVRDTLSSAPKATDTKDTYPPFRIDCGQGGATRCDAVHQIGENPYEEGNTRQITMPGEPFGVTIAQDGASLVVTHQSDTKVSLFSTGLSRKRLDPTLPLPKPAISFVADGAPLGGIGVAGIPHDPDALLGARELPRPAFLETSRYTPEVSLLRRYDDDQGGLTPNNRRPFLDVETAFPITVNAGGTDSRGIAIDPTPRIACKARVPAVGPNMTVEQRDQQIQACARKPARVFIANRSPASLLVGDVGTTQGIDANYDPDRLTIHTSVPLAAGPSRVYLAPIVDRDGAYALRVFVVCFDSATIYVYDPDAGAVENILRVAPGPFAMAFDPFLLSDVAVHAQVPADLRDGALGLRQYRFAYVASFTQSYVQVLDLDNATPNPVTFERIVYTLGRPTNPKGT